MSLDVGVFGPYYTRHYRIIREEHDKWRVQQRWFLFFWENIGFGTFPTKRRAISYIRACIAFDLSGRSKGTPPQSTDEIWKDD